MDIYLPTDTALIQKIGAKTKELRIANRLTQKQLATDSGVSVSAICNLESGKNCSLSTLVPVLRTLRSLDMLEPFVRETPVSPIAYAKMQKSASPAKRVRNSKNNTFPHTQSEW